MSKPYVRQRAGLSKPQTFTCIKCGYKAESKLEFKQHWGQNPLDHDERRLRQ